MVPSSSFRSPVHSTCIAIQHGRFHRRNWLHGCRCCADAQRRRSFLRLSVRFDPRRSCFQTFSQRPHRPLQAAPRTGADRAHRLRHVRKGRHDQQRSARCTRASPLVCCSCAAHSSSSELCMFTCLCVVLRYLTLAGIYDRDVAWLKASDVVIAECSSARSANRDAHQSQAQRGALSSREWLTLIDPCSLLSAHGLCVHGCA